jgi:hypothetical protein
LGEKSQRDALSPLDHPWSRNKVCALGPEQTFGSPLARSEGRHVLDRPEYEPSAWLLLVEWIGGALRERYRPPKELPRAWLTMLDRLVTKLEIPARNIKGFADETIENLVERDRFADLDYHERQMERVAAIYADFRQWVANLPPLDVKNLRSLT